MNWLDIVILVALLVPAVLGLWQGFVKTLLSLVGLIVGVIVASNFYEALARMLTFISDPGIANIVAFALILVAVMVLAAVVASILRAILKAIMLGWVDKLAGAVLGLLFGAIFMGAVLAGFVKFFGEGLVTESLLAGLLLDKLPLVLALLPREFDSIREFFR
jgi:membrane protein required for colicin V production